MRARVAEQEGGTWQAPVDAQLHVTPSAPLLTIVVPTRNERDNVAPLVDRLERALAGVDIEIIFVDDSEDDTPQVIAGLRRSVPVYLIRREAGERKGGLTTAIVRGLRAAHGQYISVLDGDLQHPPEKVRAMLAEAQQQDADIVAASRYLRGGSASGLPGGWRRAVSIGSKWVSKLLFYERLGQATDPGSGFFLVRRRVIDGAELRPVGYKMLTEILVRGHWSRFAEVPYRFEARTAGASKAGLRQGVQYLHHTARIFREVAHVARLWKFLLVGATGVAVNLGLLGLLVGGLHEPRYVGWTAGVEASILSNFLFNRTFTWRDRRAAHLAGAVAEGGRYHLSSVAGVAANLACFALASWLGLPALPAGALGIAAGLATNFAGAARFVFPTRLPQRPVEAPPPRLAAPSRQQITARADSAPDRRAA